MTTKERIEALAENYRQELGLKPWDEFEREQLKRWKSDSAFSEAGKEEMVAARRQCGKSTKALLFSLAEAVITGKTLLICGSTKTHTRSMHDRAVDLAESLKLDVTIEMFPRQVVMFSESFFH